MEQAAFSAFQKSARASDKAAARRAFDPMMGPIYIGLALSWAGLLVALPLSRLSLDIVTTVAFVLVCGLIVWTAACLRLRGLMRIATGIETWAMFALACLTGILGTYVAARCATPFADHWMVSADRAIAPGLGWRKTILELSRHTTLMLWADRAYASLQWQTGFLILLCCTADRTERCAAFLLRWMIALALVCLIFACLPCNGPYATYAIAHSAVPTIGSDIGWRQPELLAWLRTTGSVRLDPSALDGIVEFPSFHAAAAILLAWGFWPMRWARWPMLALNIVMIAAAVPVGGHYYIDLVAGVAVAGISIKLPAWCSKLWTHAPARSPDRQ